MNYLQVEDVKFKDPHKVIRRYREQKGWTGQQLADKLSSITGLKCDNKDISKWENNKGIMHIEEVHGLEKTFKCQLFDSSDKKLCSAFSETAEQKNAHPHSEKFTVDGSDFSATHIRECCETTTTTVNQPENLRPWENAQIVGFQRFLAFMGHFMSKIFLTPGFHPIFWIICCTIAILISFPDIQHIATLMGCETLATSIACIFCIVFAIPYVYPLHTIAFLVGANIAKYIGLTGAWEYGFIALSTLVIPELFKCIIKRFMNLVGFRPQQVVNSQNLTWG